MNCPYSDKQMQSGYLYGDRITSKWMPDSKELFMGLVAVDGEPVGQKRYLTRQRIRASKCQKCKKIIIDLNDPEN